MHLLHFLFWLILLGAIIALGVRINRMVGRRETERNIIKSQQVVNASVNEVIRDLAQELNLEVPQRVTSTLVANIWGYNVMAYEFKFNYEVAQAIVPMRQKINTGLGRYTLAHEIISVDEAVQPIIVTDLWYDQLKPVLHMDVAYVSTEQTAAYLRDLKKLNQPFQT